MKTYKHSLANYPKNFHGYVVSPHKICIQFKDVGTKLRVAFKNTSDLIKLPSTEVALPIVTKGVGIDILAVGCEFPVLEDLQMKLLDAYKEYYMKHKDDYKRLYGKSFKDFLYATQLKLSYLLSEVTE